MKALENPLLIGLLEQLEEVDDNLFSREELASMQNESIAFFKNPTTGETWDLRLSRASKPNLGNIGAFHDFTITKKELAADGTTMERNNHTILVVGETDEIHALMFGKTLKRCLNFCIRQSHIIGRWPYQFTSRLTREWTAIVAGGKLP